MHSSQAKRFEILMLNQISPNGLKRLPAERYTVSKEAARPDAVFCFSDFAVRDASGAEHRRYLSRWNPGLPPWSR